MSERRKRGSDRDDYRETRRGESARYGRDEPWREEARERYPNERYGGDRSARSFEGVGRDLDRRADWNRREARASGERGADYRRDFAPEGYGEPDTPSGYGHGYGHGFGDSGDYRAERSPRQFENQRGPEQYREREWQARPDSGAWNRGRTSGGFGSEYASWRAGVTPAPEHSAQAEWDSDWAANRPARGPGRWGADWSNERSPSSGENYAGRAPRDYRRSDDRIREEVCDRFTDDPYLDPSEVTVKVENSEITLTGSVANREQKRRAEELAERVSGVREVINQLRVSRGETTGQTQQTSTRSRAGGTQPSVAADREK